jgi:N-acyl homoserine lactone hydrolase
MKTTVNKLFVLPAGYGIVKEYFVNTGLGAGSDKMAYFPLCIYLLETSEGPILIDTGYAEALIDNPNYYDGKSLEGILYPYVKEEHRIPALLKTVGYRPEDISLVISTHFHCDHSGGHKYFPSTPILVQKNELTILDDENYSPAECRLKDLNYRVIDGDHQLSDDILLLSTPGHSPGHQSLLVNTTNSGPVLLCIDAALTESIFTKDTPYIAADPEKAGASLHKLKDVAREYKPLVFYGHDEQQAKNWKTGPEFY